MRAHRVRALLMGGQARISNGVADGGCRDPENGRRSPQGHHTQELSSTLSQPVDVSLPFDFSEEIEELAPALPARKPPERLVDDFGLCPARRELHGRFERVIVDVERGPHASVPRRIG